MTAAAPHGTYARYQKEVKAGIGTCPACKIAARRYAAVYRARTGTNQHPAATCAKGLGWPFADPWLARILEVRP